MKNLARIIIVTTLSVLTFFSYAENIAQSKSVNTQITPIAKVNINQADVQAFSVLKGIGTQKAQAIVEYRRVNGNFAAVDELLKVKGIGKKVLAQNKVHLTI